MNTYLIEYKVTTVAYLYEDKPLTYGGYEFQQWEYCGGVPKGHAWTASKEVNAENWGDARMSFISDLLPIVNRISVASQCYASADIGPYLIIRKNNNAERLFRLWYVRTPGPNEIAFRDDEIETVAKLDALGDKIHALIYLREATNAYTFLTRFMMLLAALEALAGEKKANVIDKDFIKNEILQDEEFADKLFKSGEGLRNAIAHGKPIDTLELTLEGIDYISKTYNAIIGYLNRKFELKIDTNVVNPQRTLHGVYQAIDEWISPDSEEHIQLRLIMEQFDGEYSRGKRRVGRMRLIDAPEAYWAPSASQETRVAGPIKSELA